jgi:hypothetical protein
VGNSRSGTTMMLRILDNHPQIFGLNELHFFEQLWSTADKEKIISKSDAQDLAARLLYIQRKGYMGFSDTTTFATEANTLVEEMNNTQMTGQAVYAYFMKRETSLQNKLGIHCLSCHLGIIHFFNQCICLGGKYIGRRNE